MFTTPSRYRPLDPRGGFIPTSVISVLASHVVTKPAALDVGCWASGTIRCGWSVGRSPGPYSAFRTPHSALASSVPSVPSVNSNVIRRSDASPSPPFCPVQCTALHPHPSAAKTACFPREIRTSPQFRTEWFIVPAKNPLFSSPKCPQNPPPPPKKQKPSRPLLPIPHSPFPIPHSQAQLS
jgi:hypothetical protein